MAANPFFWLTVLGCGLGAALSVHGFLAGAFQLFTRSRRPRLNTLRSYDRDQAREPEQVVKASMPELLGMEKIPWLYLYLGAAGLAFAIYFATRQVWVLPVAVLPILYRLWLARYRQRGLMQSIWQFLMDLRIRLTLRGTLLLALQDVCAQNPSRIAQALGKYLAAGYAENGMALLARLDADVPGLPFLGDLVTRTAAAQEGTLDMDQALRQVMESLQQEMKTASREQLQKIPSRLILMAFPALLMPALFLLVFPLAARLIASLQGMTWGSGF